MRAIIPVQIVIWLFLSSCLPKEDVCEISEYFITQRQASLNVDSVAVWHNRDTHWLIATAKSGHVLPVYDALTGEFIKEIGKPGFELGQLQRPNGIAVVDNLVFVTERDNKRMQIFSLPDGHSIGVTEGVMQKPYGIAVIRSEGDSYDVYITDNYAEHENADKIGAKKVHHYRVTPAAQTQISLVKTFGDEDGPGKLCKVESIAIDKAHNRLIIADEHAEQKNIKIYTLDGIFTGQVVGKGLFKYEPEGIALYEIGANDGYIVATDQDRNDNRFYLFDRDSLAYLKTIKGKFVKNTDGIAIVNRPFGPFKSGAFYAVHDDGNICAYDWHKLAHMCGLREYSTSRNP